jgi:hypothetical protein
MYITIKNVVDAFLVYFKIFCRYETLWDGPMTMVASSFRGLVLKSFMVEIHKHVYQKQTNNLNVKAQNCCEKFLNFFKGVCFIMYHISMVPKIYQSISSGNANKSPRIQLD